MAEPNVELVAFVKQTIIDHNLASLVGPCGAFAITKSVVWELRDQGFGFLSKPGGNNCEGKSVDYVVQKTPGANIIQGYDILGDSGNSNVPAFNRGDTFGVDRWLAPEDPGFDVSPDGAGPGDTNPATPPVVDGGFSADEVVGAFQHLEEHLAEIKGLVTNLTAQVVDLHTRVQWTTDAINKAGRRTYHGNARFIGGFDLTPVEIADGTR